MQSDFDIAIVGGGMVGASLALALAQGATGSPLSIALFEAYPLPENLQGPLSPSYDARATALAYGSALQLARLGVWQGLADQAAAIEQIEVTDRGHFGVARLVATEEQVPALGYVVENRRLGQALLSAVAQQPGIELICPASVVAARFQADNVELEVVGEADRPESTRARLLVIADGGRSTLCQQLQIDQHNTPYEQCAVIANVTLDRPHQGCAYERFTAQGPMALLPLSDDAAGQPRAALVWSVPLAEADEVMGWDDRRFMAELQQRFGYRAGCLTRVGERHSYPLSLSRAREQVRRRLAVLGNAAHTLHPIAGQGFNLALRGTLALAERLLAQHRVGGDLGDLALLQAFEAGQRADQALTIGFSDQTTRLFSQDSTAAVVARNVGLLGLDLLPGLKHGFSRTAMGMAQPAAHGIQEFLHG